MATPVISSFTPTAQAPGLLVTIIGTGFTGTTNVQFGGEDALLFNVISDTQINAFPNIAGDGTITVTNLDGTNTKSGFTKIIVKVPLPALPQLGRNMSDTDLGYAWDSIRGILCQATGLQIGAAIGSGGGGGGTGSGVTQTQLGSPFKVRNTDANYADDGTDVTITDLRLVGKRDYIVSSTDFNQEFENYLSDALTATAAGVTSATDGTYSGCIAKPALGEGYGSTWNVVISATVVTSITKVSGGQGYALNDTFVLDETPGIIYTITAQGVVFSGNLLYDDTNGILTIKDYVLTGGRHVSIYADGVANASSNSFTTKMALYDKILAPLYSTLATQSKSGVIWPWRLPANLIPAGWQECTDFRGKMPIGQDPLDTYNATTNPQGLSQAINLALGSRTYTILDTDLPELKTRSAFATVGGGTIAVYAETVVTHSAASQETINGGSPNNPISTLNPVRIVQYIEYIG